MSLIYLDTCLLIYLVEQDPVFSSRIAEAIEREPAASFAISPLVRMECLVRPLRDGNLVIQRRFEHAFDTLVAYFADPGHLFHGDAGRRFMRCRTPSSW